MKRITEKSDIITDIPDNLSDQNIKVMQCKNNEEHAPVRWDGLWEPFYSDEGTRLAQWTCTECGGTFTKPVPDEEALSLVDQYKK